MLWKKGSSILYRCSSTFTSPGDAVRVNYEELPGNKGSPLVVTHGMLGSKTNWSSISKALNKDLKRRIVSFDARNHGDSPHTEDMGYLDMVQDLKLLCQITNIDSGIFIGHSMGGRTMMATALIYPDLMEKLICLDISPVNKAIDVNTLNGMTEYFHIMKDVEFLDESSSLSEVRKHADRQMASRIPNPGLRAWLLMNVYYDSTSRKYGWKINVDGIHRGFLRHLSVFPESLKDKSFAKPVLFIGGAESDYIPTSDHAEIRKQFPKAEFVYVPGAGHWVHSQKPTEVIKLIKDFVMQ